MLLKESIFQWLRVLAGTTIVLVNLISPSVSLLPSQVEEIARQSTARIYVHEGAIIGIETAGSVVLIARKGNTYYGVTNAHVVQDRGDYFTLFTRDGQKHHVEANQVKPLPNVDMAVVRFTSDHDYPLLQLGNSDSVQIGQTIYLTGWLGGIMLYCSYGKLLDHSSQLTSSGFGLAYSNVSSKGMSGGSVLDEEGRLIGIHSARGTITSSSNPDSSVTVGLGIPINTLILLAPQAGLDPELIDILNSTPGTVKPSNPERKPAIQTHSNP